MANSSTALQVWSYGYAASLTEWSGSGIPLDDRASNFHEFLAIEEIGERRPVVFIGYSLGGLLVKKVLQVSSKHGSPIVKNTRGVVFLATPHTGSGVASLLSIIGTRPTAIALQLQAGDPELITVDKVFRELIVVNKIFVKSFYETLVSKRFPFAIIVDKASADMTINGSIAVAVTADHESIAKPATENEMVYRGVVKFLEKLILSLEPNIERSGLQTESYSELSLLEFAERVREEVALGNYAAVVELSTEVAKKFKIGGL